MTTEWIELPTLQDVAKAQADGWEIQKHYNNTWIGWSELTLALGDTYRARPRQPKMKKVKMLCYFTGGGLEWHTEIWNPPKGWIRIPAQDIEIEVPDEL